VLKNVPVPRSYSKKETDAVKKKMYSLRKRLIKKLFIQTNYKYWLIKLLPIQPYPEFNSQNHPYWLLGRKILEKFIEASKQKTIIITLLPSWSIIMKPKLAKCVERFDEFHNPGKNVFVCNILPYFLKLKFKDKKKCFNSKYDHHYSVFGHRIVADGLYSEMKKLNIFNIGMFKS
jgi:hypothetical protein